MSLNNVLIIAAVAAITIFAAVACFRARKTPRHEVKELESFDSILAFVKEKMVELDRKEISSALSPEEFDREHRAKATLSRALANSVHGIESAKLVVIDLIRNILEENVDKGVIRRIMGFDDGDLSPMVKFEILLYKLQKKRKKEALTYLIEKYSLANERADEKAKYYIDTNDINNVFAMEDVSLSDAEMTELFARLIFQKYRGFGAVDTIREMNIDGINVGVSGSKNPQRARELPNELRFDRSCWLFYHGIHIHLRFLRFDSADEIRRIVQGLIRYGSKGALTRNVGRMVVSAPDQARITALCPPAADGWAAFIRKFTQRNKSTKELIVKNYTNNGDIAVNMLSFLMRGMVTVALTGQQASGKTSLLQAIIEFINPVYTLRTLEMAFELYLPEAYPERNILAVQETDYVSASVLQDTLKKTDAAVSIVGEVATDEVALRMIQTAQVASLFTLFTHHAITAYDLVMALRNSIVSAGGFSDMSTAEKQILDVLKINVHLARTPDGKRYVERITEIVPLSLQTEYPLLDTSAGFERSSYELQREYYTRRTDRPTFETRDIMRYDTETDTYYMCGWFSDNLEKYMLSSLRDEDRAEFLSFKDNYAKGGDLH